MVLTRYKLQKHSSFFLFFLSCSYESTRTLIYGGCVILIDLDHEIINGILGRYQNRISTLLTGILLYLCISDPGSRPNYQV